MRGREGRAWVGPRGLAGWVQVAAGELMLEVGFTNEASFLALND